MGILQPLIVILMQLSMFSLEERLVRTSPSPDSEQDWTEAVATCRSNLAVFLAVSGPNGSVGRTSLASSQVTTEKILQEFWECSQAEALVSPPMDGETQVSYKESEVPIPLLGGCWTLNTLEFPKEGVASSLSDVLEPIGDVPSRYFLSPTACRGILRRAAKRGKNLPLALRQALQQTIEMGSK